MRFSCGGCMLPAASARSVSLNVARFHFSAVFWNRATSCTPVVAEKCRKNRFGGYEIGGKNAFRQEKCCTIRNLPRKSESCNKIRRFLPWLLIPGRFPRHGIRHGLGVRTVGQEAQWRAQGLPIAIVEGGSPSRTVGSCATSSRTLLSVTARVPTAGISRV